MKRAPAVSLLLCKPLVAQCSFRTRVLRKAHSLRGMAAKIMSLSMPRQSRGVYHSWGCSAAEVGHRVASSSSVTTTVGGCGRKRSSAFAFARTVRGDPKCKCTADTAHDARHEGIGAIEELHAQLPFSRELWGTFMDVYWQKKQD